MVCFFFQHLGQSRVSRLFFLCMTVTARWRTKPFCRTLWSVDCSTGRAEFTSVCCGDAHWCILHFRDCAFVLQVGVSIIFLVVRRACEVLLWLGPWPKMTANLSVDDCVSTVDSPTLTHSVGLPCISARRHMLDTAEFWPQMFI